MMSSEADSDVGEQDDFDAPGGGAEAEIDSGARHDHHAKDVDVDGVQKTPEVTRQPDRMLVDHMDTA
jgi:hypothetical protein